MILHKNLVLLRLAGPSERAELRALIDVEHYVVGELSPTELLIDPANLRKVLEAMEVRGIKPLVRKQT